MRLKLGDVLCLLFRLLEELCPPRTSLPKRGPWSRREAPARLDELDQFTVFSVVIDIDRHPTTYEGMSGGGLWLLTAPDGDTDNMQRFFIGTISSSRMPTPTGRVCCACTAFPTYTITSSRCSRRNSVDYWHPGRAPAKGPMRLQCPSIDRALAMRPKAR